jgi:hypothetical protein
MRATAREGPRAKHDEDADSAARALRYVADAEDYDAKRSQVWRNAFTPLVQKEARAQQAELAEGATAG